MDRDQDSRLLLIFKAGYKEGQKLYVSLPLLRFCRKGSSVTSKSSTTSTAQSYMHFYVGCAVFSLGAFEECMMDLIQSTPSFELLLLHPLPVPKQALHSC